MRRMISLFLAVLTVLALLPATAFAASEQYVVNNSGTAVGVFKAIGDGSASGELASGAKDKYLGTETKDGVTWYRIPSGYVKKVEGVELVTEKTPELKAEGGSYPYDGKAHAVTAKVIDGEGYTIEYSTDGGSTWAQTVPSRTEVGKVTIKVRAVKGDETLTCNDVTLEITEAPKSPKPVTAMVEDGEGYTIEYSIDGGKTWSATAPSLTQPGKVTVKVRALKSGAETLTCADVVLEVTEGKAPKLTASGESVTYDGKEHTVTAKVENGEGYTIEYSTDGGKTWSEKAPVLKEVGKLTVKVRATKSGADTLTCDDVVLEVKAAEKESYKTVTIVNCKKCVNVRKGASSSTKAIGAAKKGAVYKMLGKEGKWYKIQYTEKTEGYVYYEYVKEGSSTDDPTPTPTPAPDSSGKIVTVVNCKICVNVRKGPSSHTTKLGTADKGKQFPYLGTEGKWDKIQYTDKTVGYIYTEYTKISDGTAPVDPADSDDDDPAGKIVTIVNCKVRVNVRKGAGTDTAKIGTADKGKKFTYLGKVGSWYKIQYNEKTVGYVYAKYGKVSSGSATPDPVKPDSDNKTGTIVNCKTMVNVRAEPSSKSKLLGTAKKGSTYKVLGTSGSWTKIEYNGKEAYVFSKYIKVK